VGVDTNIADRKLKRILEQIPGVLIVECRSARPAGGEACNPRMLHQPAPNKFVADRARPINPDAVAAAMSGKYLVDLFKIADNASYLVGRREIIIDSKIDRAAHCLIDDITLLQALVGIH